MSDPYRDWDAAYVLGALSPAERREYEGHLGCCVSCAAAVASFAGMPGMLSMVPRETSAELLEPVPPRASLVPGLARTIRASRRRGRTRVAAALAATALAGAVAGSRLVAQGCSPDPRIDRTTSAPATTPSAGRDPASLRFGRETP
ncbi:zf-HC2 domain-containing protein [Amycolatopsis sp. DG1A-15b]|uniref:zf-HC2 domain-containing protein n=1 Tax=Amycolatopsis sp. DG1A-15b TaxID=3052846 RepID=UPI00255BE9AA|nr:zf-HC2 domain-containing protein [Amycolatopsis sp. DG1A-15b]WIX93096.1 zf-HC2 domain-containing protein [Amycolatopsis sp. DG1A-15b]